MAEGGALGAEPLAGPDTAPEAPPLQATAAGGCAEGSTTITPREKKVRAVGATVQDAIDDATMKQGGHVASVLPGFAEPAFCPNEAGKPVKSAAIAITETRTVPVWPGRADVPAAAQAMWDGYIAVVEAHEQRHVDIDMKHFGELHLKLQGKTPAAALALIERVKTAADAENAKLDAREGCIKLNGGTGKTTLHPVGDCQAAAE